MKSRCLARQAWGLRRLPRNEAPALAYYTQSREKRSTCIRLGCGLGFVPEILDSASLHPPLLGQILHKRCVAALIVMNER